MEYPKVIYLYDLKTEDTTVFKAIFKSSELIPIAGAIISLQRKYLDEDLFRVVEAPLTSSESTALVHIDTDSNKYKIIVIKDGEILGTFDNLVFKCQSELTGECEIELLETLSTPNVIDLETLQDLSYSISSNTTSKTITLDFSSLSGTPKEINLVAFQNKITGKVTLINRTISSSGGSLSVSYEDALYDSSIELYLYLDGTLIAQKGFMAKESLDDFFLGNNFIIIFILSLSLIFMAVSSPEFIVINSIISIIVG